MNDKKLKQNFSELASVLAKIDTSEDIYAFMRDLCTVGEMEEFLLRWEIAKALHLWESYLSIQWRTWASSTTVARVAKYLQWDGGGYKKVLTSLSL